MSCFSLGSCAAPRRRACARRLAQRGLDLLVGDLDALLLDDRREHRLPLQRQLGLGLGLADELLLGLAGDLEVLARVHALRLEAAGGAVPHLVRLRVHELVGHVELGLGHHRVDGGLAELLLDRALLGLAQREPISSRSSSSVS